MPPPRALPRLLVVVVLLGGSLAGCSIPALEPEPPAAGSPARPTDVAEPDPRLDALVGELAVLDATVAAAEAALEEAASTTSLAAARAAAERAVNALVDDPVVSGDVDGDGQVADPGVPPLFPGGTTDPDATADVLSRVLTAAREAGPEGGGVAAVLRDPVAGDVSLWEHDPGGQLDVVLGAVARGTPEAVAELDGHATRGLAWALLAVRASDLDEARELAGRGAAHLELVRVAVADLSERLRAG